ncbi:glycosyltransferase [Winogradskyella schleiferi]|uniref:glycosyltransferase n=1 Tax=Winogradskyella schleiferi TaxID=2686078 RepID=UPI0015B8C888|nr:glycosyltransferase [Winogradskyella schleiferi]
MKKLVILQTVVPDYRKDIFSYLKEELGNGFKIYSGNAYFEKSITIDKSIGFIEPIANYYFLNRKFLFQFGMWMEVFKKNVIVLEMNPRILSNWLILILRKLLFKKTVVWGHAWPRAGSESKSDVVRHLMRKLGSEIIVYTKTQAMELQLKMPNKIINAAPNALYFKKDMATSFNSEKINHLIYVGRLSKPKKAFFLVKAFHNVLIQLPETANLIIVGEGEEKPLIENYIREHKITNRVLIKGHVSNIEKLKEFYSEALFSISPGYVGLSITQSFSFGVPMIISKHENHSPEIEASQNEINSLLFDTDNIASLGETIVEVYNHKSIWIAKRQEICLFCRHTYSTEAMGQTFLNILK